MSATMWLSLPWRPNCATLPTITLHPVHYVERMHVDAHRGVGMGQNMRFSDIVIDDPGISMAAKGVFSTLGLMGNSCSISELASRTKDKQQAVLAALGELERAGYIKIVDDKVEVLSSGSFGVIK